MIAIQLIPGQLPELIRDVQRCMAFSLLQREQMLLKCRVVQIEADRCVRLRHGRGASGWHSDQHQQVLWLADQAIAALDYPVSSAAAALGS